MAEQAIGANAIFSGPQKGLTTIGDHCYAYSGLTQVNDNETTLLLFNTGKKYIKAQIQFSYASNSNQDFTYAIYFNGVIIQQYNVGNSLIYTSPDNFVNVIIPPLTEVKLTSRNLTDASGLDQIVSLIGRVY